MFAGAQTGPSDTGKTDRQTEPVHAATTEMEISNKLVIVDTRNVHFVEVKLPFSYCCISTFLLFFQDFLNAKFHTAQLCLKWSHFKLNSLHATPRSRMDTAFTSSLVIQFVQQEAIVIRKRGEDGTTR